MLYEPAYPEFPFAVTNPEPLGEDATVTATVMVPYILYLFLNQKYSVNNH
jgi:hypothetical protein